MSESPDLARAAELVDEAARHCYDASLAHERGNAEGVRSALAKLGSCLRRAQKALGRLADAADPGGPTVKEVQTSAGVIKTGGSTSGRGSPLLNGDIGGWLARARLGARNSATE